MGKTLQSHKSWIIIPIFLTNKFVLYHSKKTEMKPKYIIFLLTLFCYSCLNMNDPDSQARYSESYNSFDKKMVNHIPKKLPNNQIGFGFTSPEYSKIGKIYLLTKISSKTEFIKIKETIFKQAIYVGFANDKRFAIVEDLESNLADTGYANNSNEIFPIPIESITSNELDSINKKYENAEVVIKECKLGDFINLIKIKSNQNIPIKNKSGFSKGFTFVEKDLIVIYWTMNW